MPQPLTVVRLGDATVPALCLGAGGTGVKRRPDRGQVSLVFSGAEARRYQRQRRFPGFTDERVIHGARNQSSTVASGINQRRGHGRTSGV